MVTQFKGVSQVDSPVAKSRVWCALRIQAVDDAWTLVAIARMGGDGSIAKHAKTGAITAGMMAGVIPRRTVSAPEAAETRPRLAQVRVALRVLVRRDILMKRRSQMPAEVGASIVRELAVILLR
jgi:hypothetical protein